MTQNNNRVPTWTGKWEGIFQLGYFEQTGKVSEKHTKTGKVREFQTNFVY